MCSVKNCFFFFLYSFILRRVTIILVIKYLFGLLLYTAKNIEAIFYEIYQIIIIHVRELTYVKCYKFLILIYIYKLYMYNVHIIYHTQCTCIGTHTHTHVYILYEYVQFNFQVDMLIFYAYFSM